MGLLDKQLEKLHKDLEKAFIEGLGIKSLAISSANKLKIKKREEETIEIVQNFMNNNADSMEGAVKGNFGKKIKESLENQKKMLNDL